MAQPATCVPLRNMKPAAFIFSVLMLFFTAQPFLVRCQPMAQKPANEMACCGGKSCHKKEMPQKAENKNCDGSNSCNPFAGCSQCQYTTLSATIRIEMIELIDPNKGIIHHEALQSGFLSDCWHPPESSFA